MSLKTEITWAALLLGTAALSFYLGIKAGTWETEENIKERVEEKAKKIKALENKIQQLSEELTSRGIFSYPQASVVSKKGGATATVLVNLNGREPIEDLEIERQIRSDDFREPEEISGNSRQSGRKTSIGTLTAHNPVAFELENFKNKIAIDLTYKSQRNQWRQYLIAKRSPEGGIKTFWVITNKDSEVIDKHIDDGFPVDSNGDVVLGENKKIKYSEIKMNSIFNPIAPDQNSGE